MVSSGIQRIINSMAELKKMYQLVDLVSTKNTATGEDNFMIGFADEDHSDSILLENKEDVLMEFCKATGLSKHKAEQLLKNAEKREYLSVVPIGVNRRDDKLKVLPDGDDLIFKRWKIPTGLIRAIFDENKQLVSVLGLVSAIVVTVATVINVLILARAN